MPRCPRCLLPLHVPGAAPDAAGVCRWCREDLPIEPPYDREPLKADLERALRTVRGSHPGPYDCLVPLSGGKDSLYLLHRLRHDYGLRVLAFTAAIDLPPVAWSSIRLAVDRLGVDHLVWKPSEPFLRKLFRYVLCNQEERGAVYTLSHVYAPLFEGEAIRTAAVRGIPLILAGYSPGQPEPERMRYEFPARLVAGEDWTPPHLRACGAFDADDLGHFFDPRALPAGTALPRYLAPFHAWDYDQEAIIAAVARLGLVRRRAHASPVTSNYPINWLMMHSDLRHFGYNPYVPEFSALIRTGRASRLHWRLMFPVVDFMIRHRVLLGRNITASLRWLGLRADELRITLPRGAYDPAGLGGGA